MEASPPPIRTGVQLGRHQVQEYLGEGPYGPIFRAYDAALSRSTVIQVLNTLRDPEPRARLAQAAPLLVALRHPNLLDTYEVGEREGVPYLVSAHLETVSLGDAIRSGMSLEGGLRLLHGIAQGIDYAHSQGILHGDLRPETVLVGPQGRPLIRGTGLMPLLDPGFRGSSFGITAGSLHYQAPEQLEKGEVTAATDRYSYATVAYEVMTGATPFPGQTVSDVLAAKERQEPVPASSRNHALGSATDGVLASGLARAPNMRWQSCVQMAQALSQAVADDTYPAYQAPEAAAGPVSRSPWPWVLGGLALLALAAAAAVGAYLLLNNPAPAPSLSLSTDSVQAGNAITISADHLPANQIGSIQLESDAVQIGTFQAGVDGSLVKSVTIPSDINPGAHLIQVCWRGQCPLQRQLTVRAAPPSPTPPPTPTPTPPPTPTPRPTPTPTPTPTPRPSSTH